MERRRASSSHAIPELFMFGEPMHRLNSGYRVRNDNVHGFSSFLSFIHSEDLSGSCSRCLVIGSVSPAMAKGNSFEVGD